MKKLLLLLVLLSFCTHVLGQDTVKVYSKEYYLQKSKNQKTTAWILLGAGTTMIIVGVVGATMSSVIYIGTIGTSGSASNISTYGYIAFTGLAADLASIPFFISASKNKRLAAQVSISNQKIYSLQTNSVAVRCTPGVTIKIGF